MENHSASTPSSSQGMNDDYTIQKHGLASRCTKFEADPPASSTSENAILGSGQSFANADEFRNALYLMSLAGRFRYKFKRNCPRYVSVCCAVDGCTWKIAACGVKGTKMMRVYTFQNNHNHSIHEDSSPLPTVRLCKLAVLTNDVIKATPDCMPRQICKDFERQHGIRMTYSQAWQYREKVKERIFGLSDNSYKLLPWLCVQLTKSNPGTIAEWTSSDEGNFMQLFVAYGACVHGFLTGCRPIISIDSSELGGLHKGTLLSASAYDGDDNMFLIAYAIVSSKTYDDWLWFFQKLKQLVGKMEVVIISDMHLDIVRSVAEVFGVENHIYCYQHLKESFSCQLTKKNTKGRKGKEDALMFLDAIAYTRLQIDYIRAMENLRRYSANLAKWIEDSGPEHWALSKFSKKRWDKMNTNLAGLFDDLINEDQHHSIFNFVVKHMEKLASLLIECKAATQSWKRFISPKIEDKVLLNIAKAEAFTVIPYTDTFKVKTRDRSHCVDLKQHTCTCSAWQMLGIPCEHACAVIQMMNQDVYGFVEEWFHLPKQEMIYSGILHPLDFDNMPTVDSDGNVQDQNGVTYASLDPPTMKRRIGRPPHQRNKFQFREKGTVFCSHCNGAGHNCTTCKNPTI